MQQQSEIYANKINLSNPNTCVLQTNKKINVLKEYWLDKGPRGSMS